MGNVVGGLIGGVGSLLGGNSAKHNDLTGFNYLSGKNGVGSVVNNGTAANATASALLNGTANPQQTNAFNTYLNSTGYNFQKQQGTGAITGSAAARGMLNSGGTAKALQKFGQGQGANYFSNYINQLGSLTGQGLTASGQIGQAGTQGGTAAGTDMGNALSFASGVGGAMATNVFGTPAPDPFAAMSTDSAMADMGIY